MVNNASFSRSSELDWRSFLECRLETTWVSRLQQRRTGGWVSAVCAAKGDQSYSSLSASSGLTRVARRVGTDIASSATNVRPTKMPLETSGSVLLTS